MFAPTTFDRLTFFEHEKVHFWILEVNGPVPVHIAKAIDDLPHAPLRDTMIVAMHSESE